jgi:hypothetical protein
MSGLSRGEFFKVAGAFVTALIADGCLPKPETGSNFDDIKQYYPELSGLRVYDKGKIYTLGEISWYNLTPYQVNQKSLIDTIAFYETFTQQGVTLPLNYTGTDVTLSFTLQLSPHHIFFFLPATAPNPSWYAQKAIPGITTHQFDMTSIALIRDLPPRENSEEIFTTQQAFMEKAFSVEACQSIVLVNTSLPEAWRPSQELFCNNVGRALAAKTLGIPYQEYAAWANQGKSLQSPDGTYRIPLFAIREQLYNLMPASDPVLQIPGH